VPSHQYEPKHRAVPAPAQPVAWAGPRHLGERKRTARRAVRTTVTMGGLAFAATGVAVSAGVVHAPGTAVSLADSLTPTPSDRTQVSADLSHRSTVISRSADRTRPPDRSRTADRTRPPDRRAGTDPAKKAALGLVAGPAVGGQENLTSQDPQAIAAALLPSYGWSSSEMSCLVPLWMGESGWRVDAMNPTSGAYGIPQALPASKMASAGGDWQTNAETQIKWGLSYIQSSYGSPCGAWGFKQGHGWY
jgi:hypothetical protein